MTKNESARGIYSLVFDISHSKKTLKIPVYERGEFRYSVDIVTIDQLLFSKEMQAKNKNELRTSLITYVSNLINYLITTQKQSQLLKQCRELLEELRITNYNFDFYIQSKNKSPILYQPTEFVKYVNEIYAFDEQAVTYNKEKLRHYIYENEDDVRQLVRELFHSLLYDIDIYLELLYSEKDLTYLMNKINLYKSYQTNLDQESMVGMNDLRPVIDNELLNYKNLRLILNHSIILKNKTIKQLNDKVKDLEENRVEDLSFNSSQLEELFQVYDLDNFPREYQRFIDGTGKRK